VNFSERPASEQWAALKYAGMTAAEVWFKPEGEPFALTFRIPRESFDVPGMGQRLTAENLLKAVGIAAEEVASWRHEGDSDPGTDRPDADLRHPLPPPQGATHLTLRVSLKPPPQVVGESGESDVTEAKWQDLESLWKNIQGLEASVETLRISMEALRAEMEASSGRSLTPDEKVHALNADVAQWTKAKSRSVYVLPKLRDFVHRATWATAAPERKALEEFLETHVRPRIPFSEMDRVMEQLEGLRKDRQVLSALGVSVYQEGKSVTAEVQGALRTLQGNAAANAAKKRGQTAQRGKLR
jgi:hypothetical protein